MPKAILQTSEMAFILCLLDFVDSVCVFDSPKIARKSESFDLKMKYPK